MNNENQTNASGVKAPDLEVLFELADLFKVFGDSTRIRIMFALFEQERDGKQIYYSLDDDHIKKIIEMGLDHILE